MLEDRGGRLSEEARDGLHSEEMESLDGQG